MPWSNQGSSRLPVILVSTEGRKRKRGGGRKTIQPRGQQWPLLVLTVLTTKLPHPFVGVLFFYGCPKHHRLINQVSKVVSDGGRRKGKGILSVPKPRPIALRTSSLSHTSPIRILSVSADLCHGSLGVKQNLKNFASLFRWTTCHRPLVRVTRWAQNGAQFFRENTLTRKRSERSSCHSPPIHGSRPATERDKRLW